MALKKSILEELPIRDAIGRRENDWFIDCKDSDDKFNRFNMVLEYMRSATLFVINELIKKYGQDMKNNQWVLEPYANMISYLSVVDTSLKKVTKMEGKQSFIENYEVLSLSVCQNFRMINCELDKIVNHIFNGEDLDSVKSMISNYKSMLHYNPDEIDLMNIVANRLYKNNKYYLD